MANLDLQIQSLQSYLEKHGCSVQRSGGEKPQSRKPRKPFPVEYLDEAHTVQNAVKWLEDHAPIAESGNGGNDVTYQVACELSNRGISEEKAFELLLENWNEDKADPPWEPEELQNLVNNAYQYNKNGLGSKHPRMIFEPVKASANGKNQNRFTPISWEDIEKLPRKVPLIKGLLDCGGTSVIYGPSNCGKSFFVLNLALHIAEGKPWHGRKARQGAVVYIAAEGGLGMRERLAALCVHHGMTNKPPLYIIPVSPDFCNSSKDVQEIIAAISSLSDVKLIVIDTLNRAMAGGNENSPDDMGAFIRNFDMLKDRTGAHVLIVHHSGKDNVKGARGHSSLRCAIDTEIEVSKNENIVSAQAKKQRDGKTDDIFSFELKVVNLGKDEDGDAITSCVLIPAARGPKRLNEPSGQKGRALNILRHCMEQHGKERTVKKGQPPVMCVELDEFRDALKNGNITHADKPDNARRIISRLLSELNKHKFSDVYDGYIWLTDNSDKSGHAERGNSYQADGQDNPYKGCPVSLECLT